MTETVRLASYRSTRIELARGMVRTARQFRLINGAEHNPSHVAYFLAQAAEYRRLAASASPDEHVYI